MNMISIAVYHTKMRKKLENTRGSDIPIHQHIDPNALNSANNFVIN